MLQLERSKVNPILVPDASNWWESKAVFNCSVLNDGKTIHMLYRAIGEYENYVSRIGYASSNDGLSFTKRKEVAIYPEVDYEKYGIEDPRLMTIEGETYVTYVVLSNYVKNKPSVSSALAKTNDFSHFKRLGIITVPSLEDKDVVLFPKFNRKSGFQRYMMLHRPSTWVGPQYNTERPSIWISEGDSLTNFNKRHSILVKPEQSWEALKIGAGVPPIRTKKGWLIIYHGVSPEHVYSAGAFLLDIKEPRKILGRTKRPLLTPKQDYETKGDVNNVVFPTGACILDNKLYVYYGAADKVCCLATVELQEILDYLLSDACSI
jgi:beta-1,2-mannobiose phosphorylase / 1,2-beta-oligomannan phosphorylase